MKRFSLRYSLLTSRLDQLWLSLAFFALFVLIALIEKDAPQFMTISRSYLGAVLPLVSGVLASYAVLDDPALELRFATPIRSPRMLLERLGLVFAVQLLFAGFFQVIILAFGGDFSVYRSFWFLQLSWLLPTLVLMLLGCTLSLVAANPVIGAMAAGMIWLVELIARGWFALNNGKYILIFMGAFMTDHPDLIANQITLSALAGVFFLFSWAMLDHQERYI